MHGCFCVCFRCAKHEFVIFSIVKTFESRCIFLISAIIYFAVNKCEINVIKETLMAFTFFIVIKESINS